MPKRVPQYLKEIPTALSGQTEGDYASEWGFAHNPYQHEEYGRGEQEWNANYLGWWGRGRRGVYYFGEHQRPKYFSNPESYYWEAYDWYKKTAASINGAFEDMEKLQKKLIENPNLFSEKDLKHGTRPLQVYYVPKVRIPDYIRNIKGIGAWLQKAYADTELFLNNYNKKAEKFNSAVEAVERKYLEQLNIERENIKRAAEDTKYNTIVTQLGDLRNKISNLSNNVKQLSVDKDKSFSLFKSELTSKIPDPNLNVSKYEHDEDIAQLNETLQNIRGSINKNAKKTNDSIAMLQRKVNVSLDKSSYIMADISGVKDGIEKIAKNVRVDQQDVRERFQNNAVKINALSRNQQNQSDEIDHLRKDLQALGGEAREFIDNTKRQEQAMKAKVAKKESVVTRIVKKAAFPDLTKRPWLKESVTGRFFQLANQW